MAKLILVDGNSLVHRAYHALPPLNNAKGEPTHATYGFTSMLLNVLASEKPDYVVVCFDVGRTFRHEESPSYKANRPPMPEDLAVQMKRVRELVDALGFATAQLEGYEADDLLGTLARQAAEKGIECLIVTGDTDTLQLVNPHVRVLTSKGRFSDTIIYDEDMVRQRYELEPSQLADLRGLKGDATDNIPGIPGVGEVTAKKLLQRFGSIEGIFANLEQIEPKLREKLAPYAQQALQSKRLATIVTGAPLQLDLEAARLGRYDRDRLIELFRELEFRSLVNRLPPPREPVHAAPGDLEGKAHPPGSSAPAAQMALFGPEEAAPAIVRPPLPICHHIVDDLEALEGLANRLAASSGFVIDTETTGTDPRKAQLVGLAVAMDGDEGWYIPAKVIAQAGKDHPFLRLLYDSRLPKYAHNAKYDLTVLQEHGIPVRNLAFDTMIAAYLLNEKALGLKDLAFTRLGLQMTPIHDLIGKGKGQIDMAQVALEKVAPYACADAAVTYRLMQLFEPELREQGLWPLFSEVEMPLVPVLIQMERDGVALDVALLKAMSRDLFQRISELEEQIYQEVGHRFNINSTQQLGAVLFEELKLDKVKRTKTGYSTDSSVLEELRGKHPVIDLILEHRQLVKIKSTYVDALPSLVDPRDNRVHTDFNQTATATGRLSSSNPNLQNIPTRTELGKRVRTAFIAAPGYLLLSADYSQVELRILAHISQDKTLLETFARGEDIHAATAAAIFGVKLDEVTPVQRRIAKSINFGIVYGMGDYGLAQRTDLDQKDAARFIKDYFARHPGVKQYLEETKRKARELGYVTTLMGRRRYLPEIKSSNRTLVAAAERMAVNMPIQGTAADIIKIAMVRLYQAMQEQGLRSRMILQVHDELLFEVPQDEVEVMKPLVKGVMEGALPLDAPLKVDMAVAQNWGDMEK